MSNEYTKVLVEKDESFADFAKRCARQFISLRLDENFCVPTLDAAFGIIELQEEIEKLNSKLKDVAFWDSERASKEAKENFLKRKEAIRESELKRMAAKKRYERMLAIVNEWVLPSDEYIPLRAFMMEVLKDEIKYESIALPEAKELSGEEFRKQLIQSISDAIALSSKELSTKKTRYSKEAKYVQVLLKNLQQEA